MSNVISLMSSTGPDTKWMSNKYVLDKLKKGSTILKEMKKPCLWMPQHLHGLSGKDIRGDSNTKLAQLGT